jgi:hypothetical protein
VIRYAAPSEKSTISASWTELDRQAQEVLAVQEEHPGLGQLPQEDALLLRRLRLQRLDLFEVVRHLRVRLLGEVGDHVREFPDDTEHAPDLVLTDLEDGAADLLLRLPWKGHLAFT